MLRPFSLLFVLLCAAVAHAQAILSGSVTSTSDTPLRATVVAYRLEYVDGFENWVPFCQQGTTDQGRFECRSLPPGRYALAAMPYTAPKTVAEIYGADEAKDANARQQNANTPVPITFYPGTADDAQKELLVLSEGSDIRADIRVRPTEVGGLCVVVPGGKTGMTLQMFEDGPLSLPLSPKQAFDETHECFKISDVASGQYVVVADWFSSNREHHAREHVRITAGLSDRVTLHEETHTVLQGQIQLPAGFPPNSVSAIEFQADMASHVRSTRVPVSPAGDFRTVALPSGDYRVKLISGRDLAVAGISGSSTLQPDLVRVTGSSDLITLKVNSQAIVHHLAGRISSRQTDAHTMVLLIPEHGPVSTASVGSDLLVDFGPRPQGRYWLLVKDNADELPYRESWMRSALKKEAREVTFDPNFATPFDL